MDLKGRDVITNTPKYAGLMPNWEKIAEEAVKKGNNADLRTQRYASKPKEGGRATEKTATSSTPMASRIGR